MPPQALIGRRPPVASTSAATISGVRAVSGPPDRPPRPVDILASATGIVLLAVNPSAPAARAASTIDRTPARSSSVANGGTFTNTGVAVRGRIAETRAPTWSARGVHPAFGELALSSIASAHG